MYGEILLEKEQADSIIYIVEKAGFDFSNIPSTNLHSDQNPNIEINDIFDLSTPTPTFEEIEKINKEDQKTKNIGLLGIVGIGSAIIGAIIWHFRNTKNKTN